MSAPWKPYPSDVTDDEWGFVAPYLALMRPDAPQRQYPVRELFDAVRYLIKTGCQWRMLPNNFPPWPAVYQQARRWAAAGCFEAMSHDLREVLRVASGKAPAPTACVLDGRTLRSTAESGGRAGYDGHKRTNGSKVHAAVDTLGLLLALKVTAASDQERAQVFDLCAAVQEATGQTVTLAYVDQGYTGRSRRRTRPATASTRAWSRTPRPVRGSSSCPGGGWSSGRSPGWPGPAAWPATTSGPRGCWPPGTGSRSPASCSTGSPRCWQKVHNRF